MKLSHRQELFLNRSEKIEVRFTTSGLGKSVAQFYYPQPAGKSRWLPISTEDANCLLANGRAFATAAQSN